VLTQLGDVALERGDSERAQSYYRESLLLNRSIGVRELYAMALEGLARIAVARGDDRAGVLYASAAARERVAIGVPSPPSEQASLDTALGLARERLSAQAYEEAWTEGSARSLHEVVSATLASTV
jgi:hypothetical protein